MYWRNRNSLVTLILRRKVRCGIFMFFNLTSEGVSASFKNDIPPRLELTLADVNDIRALTFIFLEYKGLLSRQNSHFKFTLKSSSGLVPIVNACTVHGRVTVTTHCGETGVCMHLKKDLFLWWTRVKISFIKYSEAPIVMQETEVLKRIFSCEIKADKV